MILGSIVRPASAVTCDSMPRPDCCPVNASLTQGGFYCHDTQQAVATNGVFTITVDPVGIDDVTCAVEFDYTWGSNCGNERNLRACWSMCLSQTPCGSGCFTHCEAFDATVNGGTVNEDHTFVDLIDYNACVKCQVVIVDVTGNTSCNPPSSAPCTYGFAGPCASNCGTPVIQAESLCEEIN